jgi:hypothetical protein
MEVANDTKISLGYNETPWQGILARAFRIVSSASGAVDT